MGSWCATITTPTPLGCRLGRLAAGARDRRRRVHREFMDGHVAEDFDMRQYVRMTDPARPSVLFVCVHNAGRSQMAAGFLAHLSGGAVEVLSAGSLPAAIWERPALCTQTNRTLGRAGSVM